MLNNRSWPNRPRAESLSKECRDVLDKVSEHGAPISINTLATLVGTHPNTLRGHLDALIEVGLVSRERAPISGRGRPSWLYLPTPAATQHGSEYATLAAVLAGQLERSSARPHDDAISAGERWGQDLAEGAPPAAEVRDQVVTLLDELGFRPELDHDDGRVRLRSCPLSDAAQQHRDVVCGVHLGMIRGILKNAGADPDSAELLAFYEPDACHLRYGP